MRSARSKVRWSGRTRYAASAVSLTSPSSVPAPGRQREHRALGVVHHLGRRRVGQPGAERGVVLRGDLGGIDPGGGAVGGGQRDRAHLAGAGSPGALHGDPDPLAGVLGQPAPPPRRARARRRTSRSRTRRSPPRRRLDGLEEPVAQHPELQAVEERVHLLAVPRLHRQVGGRHRQVEVGDQRVEPAVADHVAEVLAQRLALLAGDLVGVGDDVVEAVVLVDPAGREPGTDARAPRAGCRRSRPRSRPARGSGPAARRTSPRRPPASSGRARRRRGWGRAP